MEHPTEVVFPGGESYTADARSRCRRRAVSEADALRTTALVSHGGNRIAWQSRPTALGIANADELSNRPVVPRAEFVSYYFDEFPLVRSINATVRGALEVFTLVLGGSPQRKEPVMRSNSARGTRSSCISRWRASRRRQMRERIARHRSSRPSRWRTIEAPLELEAAVVYSTTVRLILVDCVTVARGISV